MLAGVVLPAGAQHPPGLVWVGQQPSASELAGVTSEVLGDGIATALPTGNVAWTVEQITMAAGDPIPGSADPVMYSLISGLFDFTIQSGSVQISRIAEPGPRPESPAGAAVSLAAGDAMFFPNGVSESARADVSGPATFYRVTITSADGVGATPEPSTQGDLAPAVIAIAATEAEVPSTPTPEPTAEPTQEATQAATEEATNVPTELGPGVIAVGNDTNIRVRDQPGVNTNIINVINTGDRVRITGESQTVDDFVWWPVEGITDPSVVGWIAGDFLDVDENQEG
jgi:hypothetical protein